MLEESAGSILTLSLVRWVSTLRASGRKAWSFFLKAVFLDDSFDGSDADLPARLPEFLGDDVWGKRVVEEEIADDLADDFGCFLMWFLRTALVAEQTGRAFLLEDVEELVISLFGEAELACCFGGSQAFALSFKEHGEFVGYFVVLRNGDGAFGTFKKSLAILEFEHCINLRIQSFPRGDNSRERRMSLIKYGGNLADFYGSVHNIRPVYGGYCGAVAQYSAIIN